MRASSDTDRSAFRPLGPPRSLTDELFARLSEEIGAGKLGPGERLPSEHAMMRSFGVSRTVIREAVARLKAEGLVISRQGLGVFVATDHKQRPFRLESRVADSLAEAVRIMQLRMSVEVEAAGLAAEHRSRSHLERMRDAIERIDHAIERGDPAVTEDFELHRTIAEATGNPYFAKFLDFLGHYIIPRWIVQRQQRSPSDQKAYLTAIQKEHRTIVARIAEGKADAARAAMRQHLAGSRNRYEAMAAALRSGAAARPR